MIRINLVLTGIVVGCALGVVASRHQARDFYVALSHERERARELDVEFGRLQLEQSTWAMHSRIEKIAATKLGLRVPEAKRVQAVPRLPPVAATP